MSLKGKTAVITGGSRGIGRAICLEMAQQGAHIVLCCAGNTALAEKTAEDCRQLGAQAQAISCNAADPQAVEALMQTALAAFGRIDILVNNAGITRDGLLMRMKEEDWDAVVNTNLKGAFLCMKAAVPAMLKQKYGRVVNISSVVGLRGNAGQSNYAASKAGLIGLTKASARELASRGITVNAVAPGYIQTDMTAALTQESREKLSAGIPAGRMGTAEDVARAVAFLCSEGAAYITGQVLAVDGGMSM